MLWDFRSEKWCNLLSDILIKALKCAYLVASVPDYIMLSLEILGSLVKASEEMKKKVYYNLHRLLKVIFNVAMLVDYMKHLHNNVHTG